MSDLRFEVDVSDLLGAVGGMATLRKQVSGPALKRILAQGLEVLRDQLERTTREVLAKDPTGALSRSWTVRLEVKGGGQEVLGVVGTPLAYAQIHNEGGVIKPKAGKFLAIPVRPPTARGLAPSRDSTPMVAIRSKAGKPFLADKSKLARGVVEARYLLRRQVTIQATNYVDIAVRAARQPMADELLNATVQALRRAAKSS